MGDYFVVSEQDGRLGLVLQKPSIPCGNPPCVEIKFRDLEDGREYSGTWNAVFITKYLRPGEIDVHLNAGRG